MTCPSCGYALQKLTVTTNSGGRFDVEHCGRCGGTWFDPYEINRIPYHEVVRIAKITVLPHIIPAENKNHKCPRCSRMMVVSHYESVPKGIRILRCPNCGGIWATQRALEEFKKHQEETVKEYKFGKTAFPSLSVVFMPALFSLLLLLITFSTVASLQQSRENRTSAENTIVGLTAVPLSPASESIIFTTKTPVRSSISYGPDLFSMKSITASRQPTTNHYFLLSGLASHTTYIFKITLADDAGRSYTTGENSFITK